MAWRPNDYFVEGFLDNSEPGKVTGWMKFVGKEERIVFELEGNFHRDIRGAKIKLIGSSDCNHKQANQYMQGFAQKQTGKVGDMTAGLPPADYIKGSCYIEWYSNENGRCVIELEQLRGPLGLPVERDLYFKPQMLEQIAPELFTSSNPSQQ